MKNEKGITLVAVIIYIILLLIVTAMLSTMSQFFFENTKFIEDSSKYSSEFNKFNMFFIEDIKNNKSTYEVSESKVVLKDGTTYEYKEAGIYRDKVKICNNISKCVFTKRIVNGEKEIIQVEMEVNNEKNFKVYNDYVLKYW